MWRINYRGVDVTGNNGQDEFSPQGAVARFSGPCVAHHENGKFSWQTLHKTYRSAQVCITKRLQQERMAAIAEQYKLKGK